MGADEDDGLLGQMIDHRFRILHRIGQGGMGTIYAALHVGIDKQVAVKILREKHSGHPEAAARLRIEARHAAAVCNEHIVDIFDVGETTDGRTFVVMELLAGESLAQRLGREGPLSEVDTVAIARQLAAGLVAAHAHGILHRDIKPENVFLCRREDGSLLVKLLDFGISKALRGTDEFSGRLTHTGMIMGTPLYMSPEQARGDEDLDHRIDVYALGVVLYECLTGSVPFCAKNYLGVISKILTTQVQPPRQRCPERPLSAALEQLVLSALAPRREDRYPTMAALLLDLERVAEGGAAAAPPPVRSRSRSLVWGVGISILVGTGLLLLWPPRPLGKMPPPLAAAPPPVSAPSSPVSAPSSPVSPAVSPAAPTPAPAARPEGKPPLPRPLRPRQADPRLPELLHEEQAPNPFRTASGTAR